MSASILLVIVLLGTMGGCAQALVLAVEDDIEELATLKAQTAACGNHTHHVPTAGAAGPVHIAVHEIGQCRQDRIVVMVHGILSDHRAWRFVVGNLAQDYDLMLVDLPGCGESDKPGSAALGEDGYSPAGMAAVVLEALEGVLANRPGGEQVKLTLAAHSLGGAVVLQMFCNADLAVRHGKLLSQVDSLVLLSPLEIASIRPDPMFQAIAEASSLQIDIGDLTGVLQRRVSDATRRSVCSPDRALRQEAETRMAYLRDPARRRAAQAMIREVAPWKDARLSWDEVEPVEQEYCLIDLPALIVWGRRDETLPIAMGYKLAAEMPNAELVPLPRVMHSPHIEVPKQTAELIRGFIERQSTELDGSRQARP